MWLVHVELYDKSLLDTIMYTYGGIFMDPENLLNKRKRRYRIDFGSHGFSYASDDAEFLSFINTVYVIYYGILS